MHESERQVPGGEKSDEGCDRKFPIHPEEVGIPERGPIDPSVRDVPGRGPDRRENSVDPAVYY